MISLIFLWLASKSGESFIISLDHILWLLDIAPSFLVIGITVLQRNKFLAYKVNHAKEDIFHFFLSLSLLSVFPVYHSHLSRRIYQSILIEQNVNLEG